jgi:hypothetical protein
MLVLAFLWRNRDAIEHWDKRVRMMERWSDYLEQLQDGATILQGSFRTPPKAVI